MIAESLLASSRSPATILPGCWQRVAGTGVRVGDRPGGGIAVHSRPTLPVGVVSKSSRRPGRLGE